MKYLLCSLMLVLLVCAGCGPRVVELNGEYRYFADAAQFHLCKKDHIIPVAFEGAQARMERAYLALAPQPGEWIFCRVDGYFKKAPKVDAKGKEDVLVITRLKAFDRDTGSCSELIQREGGAAF